VPNKKLQLYMNGVLVKEISTKALGIGEASDLVVGNIGALEFLTSTNAPAPYKGALDELRVYNYALSAAEITALQRVPQTISFAALPGKLLGDVDFALTATASSGLPISYASSDTTIATVANGVVRVRRAGTVTLTATQVGTAAYLAAAPVSQVLVVTPLLLQVQYKDNDNGGRPTDAHIKPQLRLDNQGPVAVAYGELTARYWLTAENYSPFSTAMEYAQLGTGQVHTRYVPLAQPREGAFGYVEFSFDASLGNLAAAGNSGDLYAAFHNQNWGDLDERNDYSHGANAVSYALNDHLTLYRNGRLVWGTEPALVAATTAVEVLSQNWNSYPRTTLLSPQLQVRNTGNQPLDYAGLTVRYWFSPESSASLLAWTDWAQLGTASVRTQVGQQGSELYLETSFLSALGQFFPSSSTGELNERLRTSNWDTFVEDNDYSYRTPGAFAPNNRITAYYLGQLVWGTEPSGARTTTATGMAGLQVTALVNPVTGAQAEVEFSGAQGQAVQLELLDMQGTPLFSQQLSAVADGQRQLIALPQTQPGVYVLKATTATQAAVVRLLKQ
jgi:hypothetical protein